MALNESDLNSHGRTKVDHASKTHYFSLNFGKAKTTAPSARTGRGSDVKSYWTFESCITDALVTPKLINSTHDLTDDIFPLINYDPDEEDIEDSTTATSILVDSNTETLRVVQLEFISFIEEKFQCSGMCHQGLFYISKNISEGIPNKTCL